MEAYDATRAGQAIAAFVDELSNWYVRRSRRRFWDGDPAAFGTLRTCLVELTKLLAPFCPFVADAIFENLDGSVASVHLCDWPLPGERDLGLETAMAVARETVRLGLAARGHGRLKVRQPLRAAVVVADGEERAAIERLAATVCEELNVKELRFVEQADELGSYDVKPNYRRSDRASASRCRTSPQRSRRSIRRTSPRRCATAAASRSASRATTTSSAPTT